MNSNRAIEILERQRKSIEALSNAPHGSPEFSKWKRDTEVAIERIFPTDTRSIKDFKKISFSLIAFTTGTPESDFQYAYLEGLSKADAILASMTDEIRDYGLQQEEELEDEDCLKVVERICLRFHSAARQLQARYNGRSTLTIKDEYDVQDLLHALLRLHFDDVRPEEWTPSYAGRAARVDFLLKNEKIVIEVKKSRQSLKDGDIGEQLLVDRSRYEGHPDCDTLVCFVYDPDGQIGNPAGLERDLETHSGNLKVRVIIAPKF